MLVICAPSEGEQSASVHPPVDGVTHLRVLGQPDVRRYTATLEAHSGLSHEHTQIDLRYSGDNEGELSVVVAPVLRFLDIGFNANIRIEVRPCFHTLPDAAEEQTSHGACRCRGRTRD